MPRLFLLVPLLTLAACGDTDTAPAEVVAFDASAAPDPPPAALAAIDTVALRAHVAALADDAMGGRGTGTPGEQLAVDYIVAQFRASGLVGGMPDGSFTQNVPLRSVRVTEATPLTFRPDVGEPASFDFVEDAALSTDTDAASVSLDGADLVFVGYGITAEGYDWDDFGDTDVAGKVLVAFVNDPPATAEEPTLFQADTLTYNGRWTYKYEEARRRGARGVLLVHTDEMAGYPFGVVADDAFGAHPSGAEPPDGALAVRGWISRRAGEALAEMSGSSLDAWIEMAGRRGFRPVELPVVADVSMQVEQSADLVGQNVVAKRPGRSAEAVVFGAHHDHLGTNDELVAAGQDGIYNGAIDNASGVAMMIEIADAFAQAGDLERTVYFVTFTAEEAGLLGSAYFAAHPPVPLGQIVANVNVDSGNLFGETDDIVGIGSERSDLRGLLETAAAAEGMTVSADAAPNQGLFFRSDQLAFARGGVPAVFINTGDRYRGREAGYGQAVRDAYRADRYHQPGDELTDDLSFGGILQQTRVAFRLGYALAASDLRPQWRPSEAFAETRRQSQAE
ncbi:M28 family peptidase [Rubrivirga sp.]|uniref:M28 family peptidase n=1 Tax=Rubrivirga sp. TaxID=1885344 RepID=UPI003B516D44